MGGGDSASICSSDMAYIRNSISGVWLRAGSIDVWRVMMRPLPWYSGVITPREWGMFLPVDTHMCLSLV